MCVTCVAYAERSAIFTRLDFAQFGPSRRIPAGTLQLFDARRDPGQTQELQDPDVREVFPVWRYDGIRDGRQGADHAAHFGHYYSSEVAFATVRGRRPYNCRCTMTPVSVWEWEELQAQGVRLSRE